MSKLPTYGDHLNRSNLWLKTTVDETKESTEHQYLVLRTFPDLVQSISLGRPETRQNPDVEYPERACPIFTGKEIG